jgi:hypothetical protein
VEEAICNDAIDNDSDGKLNCADPDCAAKLCQEKITVSIVAKRDLQRHTTSEGIVELITDPTISIYTNPKGAGWGVLEFDQLVASPNVTVTSAKLDVEFNEGAEAIQIKDAAGVLITEPAPPTSAGVRRYDVTATVKAWFASSGVKRVLEVHYHGPSPGGTLFYATEDGARGPKLVVEYEATCSRASACPKL